MDLKNIMPNEISPIDKYCMISRICEIKKKKKKKKRKEKTENKNPSSQIQKTDQWMQEKGDGGREKWVNCFFSSLNKLNKNKLKKIY